MNWLVSTATSSLGKKLLMAITGLSFVGFLCVHLAGNLTIYAGGDTFNSYASHLHSLGPLLTAAEFGLLALALVHVLTGLTLFYQNFQARPVRYKLFRSRGGASIASKTMPYTGILILAFVVFHLLNFSFVDKTGTTIFQIVQSSFSSPGYVLLYVAAMILVAFHVSHGFWSLFQTLGLNHPKYMPAIMASSIVLSLVFGFGFGLIPIYLLIFV